MISINTKWSYFIAAIEMPGQLNLKLLMILLGYTPNMLCRLHKLSVCNSKVKCIQRNKLSQKNHTIWHRSKQASVYFLKALVKPREPYKTIPPTTAPTTPALISVVGRLWQSVCAAHQAISDSQANKRKAHSSALSTACHMATWL